MSTIQIASLDRRNRPKFSVLAASVAVTALFSLVSPAQAQTQPQRPNIVVIWGDDIGFWNISAYSRGMMGYQTPNIDRIANEGALFTDVYAQLDGLHLFRNVVVTDPMKLDVAMSALGRLC